MNRKLLAFSIVLISVLGLSACGGGTAPATTAATQPPVLITEPPIVLPTNTLEPPKTYDGFDGALVLPWSWKDENPAKWSLIERPGFLRIYLPPYADDGQNTLLMEVEPGDYTVTTHVFFEAVTNFQLAGLTVFVENGIKVTFGRAFCGFIPPCVGNGIYFDYIEEGAAVNGNFATAVSSSSEAWLKLERRGDALTGSYSEDGTSWQVIGTHNLSSFFQTARVGLFTGNDMVKEDADTAADFDFFEIVMEP